MSRLLALVVAPIVLLACVADSESDETTAPDEQAAVAEVDLHCERSVTDCNAIHDFDMHVMGDTTNSCRITPDTEPAAAPNTSKVSVLLDNSADTTQRVGFSFDGYTGSGTYQLDEPNIRHAWVQMGMDLPSWAGPSCTEGSWTGPAMGSTPAVSAPDPSCGAGPCEVEAVEDDPTATPRRVTFTVRCETMCVNNGDTVCVAAAGGSQPIEFSYTATCTN